MAEKLLPCPFCSGEPKLKSYRVAEDAMGCVISCASCFASTTEYEDAYTPVEDATDAWNRRAPSPAPHLRVTEAMVNAADSVLSRSRPGIPDETIRFAIEAAIAAACMSPVPHLVWSELTIIRLPWHKEPNGDFWRAEVIGHVYEVHDDEMADYKKRQCQYDFEARIRSVLAPPAPQVMGSNEE